MPVSASVKLYFAVSVACDTMFSARSVAFPPMSQALLCCAGTVCSVRSLAVPVMG